MSSSQQFGSKIESMANPPLVVDLDGTLVKTDMLDESIVSKYSKSPLSMFFFPILLLKGKANFKEHLSREFSFDPKTLPYRDEVLELIEIHRSSGSAIVLATASSESVAKAISRHLGIFDLVISSSPTSNLAGRKKAESLIERYGAGGFDYIGNTTKDPPVWKAARVPYLAGRNRAARAAFNRIKGGVQIKSSARGGALKVWLKSLRAHQWVKNLLLFAPAIAAHKVFEEQIPLNLFLAFASFSLLASAVYLLNDILDLQNDRFHTKKKLRPIARGDISIRSALFASIFLLSLVPLVSLTLPIDFFLALCVYFGLTIAYSFFLKKTLVADVVTLAGLYTLRVIAGGLAVGIPISSWLVAFSFFIFLSLSFVKRSSELGAEIGNLSDIAVKGRAYRTNDRQIINILGAGSGLISTLVFSLYLEDQSNSVLYSSPELLWLGVPILTYWLSNLWIRVGRGEVDQDPVMFAITDKVSLFSGTALLLVFLSAQGGSL